MTGLEDRDKGTLEWEVQFPDDPLVPEEAKDLIRKVWDHDIAFESSFLKTFLYSYWLKNARRDLEVVLESKSLKCTPFSHLLIGKN